MSLACVFPGQGSQSIGMLRALGDAYPEVRETFEEASDALGFDLWALAQDGPEEDLNRTENTQPAMLAAGVAVWRVWQGAGGTQPAVMAGHSLGEYTALVCAGALAYADAVRLVAERGRLMQGAVAPGEGAMAAILGLDDAQVQDVCARAAEGGVVEAVNFNSPGQVVIAGDTAAVDRAVALASQTGARRSVKLPVSVPSHCRLMAPAAEQLARHLADVAVSLPGVPVIHNVDAATRDTPDGIRSALADQLQRPVRWVDSVRRMAADGVSVVAELGPGKVLTGLNKRIEKGLDVICVQDPDSLQQALERAGA
ncbi:[acyl-carrier-protein] S-malonyltransferase [Thioalkalivibrio denitrificans]|uniref:Malonyl CoA-acyl carrier protein transacylase n=1 Tax=Thioalkalivibrio denitrificans TaxID=108003 RepID=A0A1V3N891_9GAMM|nr:ACP S-malonyltransferase [Thioalkalivibrio denitrificans]OOG21211.1 [acyl-carrier-protein] S-malonyltransferase [Thioalkalivibrio denitrificans]